MQKKSFAAFSTALAAVLMISTGSPAYAADAADGSKMTVQQMRQPIPLSLNKVSKVLGQEAINAGYENVYVMPDGIQGWVSNGYPFEGTSWKPYESKAPVLLQRKD